MGMDTEKNMHACAFTGHRPQRFSFGFDEEHEKCLRLKHTLAQQIHMMAALGVTIFYSGMALGVDQWAAEIVMGIKRQFPGIALIGVLPCESQADKWTPESRDKYFDVILPACDEVITLQKKYTDDCMHKRNRWLVDHAGYLLAVYDGSGKGGTAYTVNYALEKQAAVSSIHPDTLEVSTNADFEAAKRRRLIQLLPSSVNNPDGG